MELISEEALEKRIRANADANLQGVARHLGSVANSQRPVVESPAQAEPKQADTAHNS